MNSLNQTFYKYKILIPVIILTGMCLWTVKEATIGKTVHETVRDINCTTTTWVVLNYKHYLAFTLIILNFVFFLLFRNYEKYILLITLVIGTFGLINFTPSDYSQTLRLSGLKIHYQTPSILVGIFTYFLYFKKSNQYISHLFYPPLKLVKETDFEKQREQIERIKERYAKYSDEELNEILNENKLMEEAIIAASELLMDRQKIQ